MDISIRQGETLQLSITADDDSADTVEFTAVDSDDNVIIDQIENFSTVDGKRLAIINTTDTDHAIGDYEYMLTIVYTDGFIEKLPDADCEDCDLPKLSICKAIDAGVS